MRVLIVDDDHMLCQMYRLLLSRVNCEVTTITDGQKALDILSTNPPDVLVTDINLPGISGIDLIKHARQRLGMDWLPIIVVTANAIALQNPMLRHANTIVKKPITNVEFIAAVEKAMNQARPRPEVENSSQVYANP